MDRPIDGVTAPDATTPSPARAPRSRTTIVIAVLTIVVVIVGLAGMWFAREHARATMMPGPSAAATLDTFIADARAGDVDDLLGAPLDAEVEATESAPFAGVPDAARALGVSTRISVDSPVLFADTARVRDENTADTARAVVHQMTTLPDGQSITTRTAVTLTRAFTYEGRPPGAARANQTPDAVSPWRVTDLERIKPAPGSDDEASPLAHAETVCDNSATVVRDLSRRARINGDLAISCLIGDEAILTAGVDEARAAATFPVVSVRTELDDARHDVGGTAQIIVDSDEGPLAVVTAEAETADGDLGWVLVGIAPVTR